MFFNDSTLNEIKSRVNIVDIIGRVIHIKKAGSNYKGACPFHNEKDPSFVVSEQKQIFTCFGCGATGDAIEFVQRYYNLDFPQAIERIANEYGIELKRNDENYERKQILYEINREAALFLYRTFNESANKGYQYMKERGIRPEALKKFGIGYADEKWDSLYIYMKNKGYDKKLLLELGLISESKGKHYDKFRNRVMFPIINTRGKVIGFGGRAIDNAEPKYLNSPENIIFHKKNNLYALNLTKQDVGKEDYAILVEGYMDVISLWQAGIKNVSASLGTALTENQARLLSRYTKNIILSYDSDGAGRAAALRGLDIFRNEDLNAKVLHVDDGKDPDDFIKKNGKEAFLKLINEALPAVEYKIEAIKQRVDVYTEEGRVKLFKEIVGILRELSPIEADIYIKKISNDTKISEGALRTELEGVRKTKPIGTKIEQEAQDIQKISNLEKNLLKLIITNPKYYSKVAPYAHVFKSRAGKIFFIVRDLYNKGINIEIKSVEEYLDDKEMKIIQDIDKNILIDGMEEQIFNDCVKEIEILDLKKREKELSDKLALTNEEENASQIKEIMEEIVQIQRIIREQEGS
ncbi:MAG: DNA primase [Eubacteriales bacterium]|nr:DNA primase [Eubacteriales bacterium]MDD4389496.1 DNA primase [Eubacteriales bacterium]